MSPTQNTNESNWLVIQIADIFVLPIVFLTAARQAMRRSLRPIRERVDSVIHATLVMNKTFAGFRAIFALLKWYAIARFRCPMIWHLVPVPRNHSARRR